MKVKLLRSITSINRALPANNKLNSTQRAAIEQAIDDYEARFDVRANQLVHTCAIVELGNFSRFTNTEDVQLCVLRQLLLEEHDLDTTTTPVSIDIPYGVMFTIIDNENGRNIRDAILGILPFKLIGKGVSTKTDNALETYGLFPMPEEN